MLVDVLAEQLAGEEEGAPRIEEGNEDVLVGTDHIASHVGLGEQPRLHGVGELLTGGMRDLKAEHRVDGLRVVIQRTANQIDPREVDVEGDQARIDIGDAGEALLGRDAAAQRRQLRAIGQRVEAEAEVAVNAFQLDAELGVGKAPRWHVRLADTDLPGTKVSSQPASLRVSEGEIGHRATVLPEVVHAAEEARRIEDRVGRTALTEVVRAELVEVPDERQVEIIEHLTGAHPPVGLGDPHWDADVLKLVVDVVAREVDRVDHIEHTEQVGASPYHLLLAEAPADHVAIGQAVVEVHVQFADEVQPLVELGKPQVIATGVQIVIDTAAAVLVAGAHRNAEGHAAARLVQVFAEHDHAFVGVARQVEGIRQLDTATMRHAGARHGAFQHDRPPRPAAVLAGVQVIDAVIAATKGAVELDVAKSSAVFQGAVGIDLHGVAKFRQAHRVAHMGRVFVEAGIARLFLSQCTGQGYQGHAGTAKHGDSQVAQVFSCCFLHGRSSCNHGWEQRTRPQAGCAAPCDSPPSTRWVAGRDSAGRSWSA